MQTLRKRNTSTPTSASQARSNCDLLLNREETLSVSGLKTSLNNPDVNLPERTQERKANMYVFVLSIDGVPLSPCKPAKARKLLRDGKAKVAKMYPFTIQLNFECENQTQEVKMGIDNGFNNIGVSCIVGNKEVVSATVKLDDKTSSRLTEKRMYRRSKRNKLRYRKPRFDNRGNKKEGWLPPSTQRRYDAHVKVINLYKSILPIKDENITIELGNFDIQKIENPEISGEGYQQGDMYGYQNMRAYIMAREKGKCQLCGEAFTKGNVAHLHHLKQRNEQGSNRAKNIAAIHKKCHIKLHKKGLKLSAPKTLKSETFMSIITSKFKKDFPDSKFTYGYITFVNRNKLEIEKTHYNDAFVIAGGATEERCATITITQKHRNNRVLQLNRNGFKPSIRKQRYVVQPKDLVWIEGKKYVALGVHNKGKGVMVVGSKKSHNIKTVEKIYNFGSFAFT